jgi:hypothetical protein
MQSAPRGLFAILALAILVSLNGCATYGFSEPAPAQKQAITIKVSNEAISWAKLPIGVYTVPESDVIISGHQKGVGGAALFGIIGIAIASSTNASAGADSVKAIENRLHIKLKDRINASFGQLIASGKFDNRLTQTDQAANPKLIITPALVLTYLSDTAVRPFLVLRAELMGANGQPIWTTRYIASSAEARPLAGANGWLENDAAMLTSVIQSSLDSVTKIMAADLLNPLLRDPKKLTMVQANFPYLKQRIQTTGSVLSEDDKQLVFLPKLQDGIVFSGVNIIPKEAVTYRPATPEDPAFKLLDEPQAPK